MDLLSVLFGWAWAPPTAETRRHELARKLVNLELQRHLVETRLAHVDDAAYYQLDVRQCQRKLYRLNRRQAGPHPPPRLLIRAAGRELQDAQNRLRAVQADRANFVVRRRVQLAEQRDRLDRAIASIRNELHPPSPPPALRPASASHPTLRQRRNTRGVAQQSRWSWSRRPTPE